MSLWQFHFLLYWLNMNMLGGSFGEMELSAPYSLSNVNPVFLTRCACYTRAMPNPAGYYEIEGGKQ